MHGPQQVKEFDELIRVVVEMVEGGLQQDVFVGSSLIWEGSDGGSGRRSGKGS